MPQLTRQLLGLIPVLGHLFAVLDITESMRELYRARQSVEEHFDDLGETARSANAYLTTYSGALLQWDKAAKLIFSAIQTFQQILIKSMSGDDDFETLKTKLDSMMEDIKKSEPI
jgi:hypothetical protein